MIVTARRVCLGALFAGLAGCGSGGSNEAATSADVQTSAEEASEPIADDAVEQDEGSDPAPLGGGGAGTIVIDGVTHDFNADVCFSEPDFLQVSGAGVADDGVPFYASISINTNEDYDDDGSLDTAADVTVEFGAETAFDRVPDDMASYSASTLESASFEFAEFEFEIGADGKATGSGEITDTNGIGTAYGTYVPLEFSGGCD